MDYRVDGYGIRREAKIAWPIYLSTLTLKGLASTISQLLKITMTDEYRCDSSKVSPPFQADLPFLDNIWPRTVAPEVRGAEAERRRFDEEEVRIGKHSVH
jgi:hypothetical protein